MNKYQLMFSGSIALTIGGILLFIYGILDKRIFLYIGPAILVVGLRMLGGWIARAYTYICRECYMRIDVGRGEALFALPAGNACRWIYCPKCRKKTACKARKVPLRRYVF